jgi:tetratricopeptide (TPR) repeat protein
MATSTLLRDAIAAAKAGRRQRARDLFLEIVENDPTNEVAWMWLSGLLDSREEQIKALENSLMISEGGGDNLTGRLQKLTAWGVGVERTKYRAAIAAFENGQVERGRSLLKQILSHNRNHEEAWIALNEFSDDTEEQVLSLENIVRLDPNNIPAREKLSKLRYLLYKNHLTLGQAYQKQEDFKEAVKAYRLAEKYAADGTQRAAAQQRLQMIESQGQKLRTTHPTLTLLRLGLGPPLLFTILIFVQKGLDPLQLTLGSCSGILVVTLGSFLMVASSHTPHHPVWIAIWGQRGLTDTILRARLRNLGIFLMLLPFLLWLAGTIQRFGGLRTITG